MKPPAKAKPKALRVKLPFGPIPPAPGSMLKKPKGAK